MQRRFILELLGLLFEGREALASPRNTGFKLLLVNEPLSVTVDQPGEALPQLPDLGVERGLLLPLGPPRGGQAAAICLGEALRLGEQGTHFLPHCALQQIRTDLGIGADALAPEAVGIGAQTAIIGIGSGVPFGRLATDGFPVEGLVQLGRNNTSFRHGAASAHRSIEKVWPLGC
jgi:hypothetical protein